LEDDVRLEYVITLEQDPATEARIEAAQARAEARAEAQRARQIGEEVRQRLREEARQQREQVIVVPPTPPWERNEIPPQVVDIVTMFFVAMVICIVGLPIARALGRWIDRRGLPSPVNTEFAAQMNRIEQAVDTMSVEVERISEAQRFQAKLLSDREKVRA
jgi:hypothetical protein